MTSRKYEEITKRIVIGIFRQVEGIRREEVHCGRSNKWQGVSQAKHQIDVSVDGRNDVLLVECKKWKEKVDLRSFLSFLARVIDIRSKEIKSKEKRHVHAVFVTTVGFDQGNIQKLADYYNIDLSVVHSEYEFLMKYKGLLAAAFQDGLNRWADEVKAELK